MRIHVGQGFALAHADALTLPTRSSTSPRPPDRPRTGPRIAGGTPITAAVRDIREPARRRDLAAGVGVAAILVPQGMAYGQLVGLQPVVGLYAALGAMVLLSLVSRTRQLIVGPEASLAPISAATVGGLSHGDPARALALSAMLALLIGAILIVAGLIRLGFLAEFLSRPVLLGYIMGVALTVIASQLEKIFGFKVDGSDFFTITWRILTHLGAPRS